MTRHSQRNKTSCDNGSKVQRIIRTENLVTGTFPKPAKGVKGRNMASPRVLQFH